MIKTIFLSICLAASSLSLNARAQGERAYSYGPVTEVDYIHVDYGHFDEYMAWVTSTWVPTMEAAKKAGLIVGYKVFQSSPKSPEQPNVYLEITFKNMAAYAGDIGDQAEAFEGVTEKVICNSACQNEARVHRNEIRRVLGTEVTREIVPSAQSQPAGLQTAFAKDAGTLSEKFTGLARVMSGKYDWKPAQGVRSVADVFNLIVKENGLLAGVLSGTPSTGAPPAPITDPEKMQEALKASYLTL